MPGAVEVLEPRHVELAVLHPARHQHAAGADFVLSASVTTRSPPSMPSDAIVQGTVMWAPNRCAWISAFWVSSRPEMPVGNPR